MSDARNELLRTWQLAEELAVRFGQPLHAFLLLHHALTCPPPALRHASSNLRRQTTAGTTTSTSTISPSTADNNNVPLHATAWDAQWKGEELATRVRAAEYLLFPDVLVPTAARQTSSIGRGSVSDASTAPRTLSRTAALESLELAEQVLAPVFASTTTSTTAGHASSTAANSWQSFAGSSGERGRSSALADVLSDAARTHTAAGASSSMPFSPSPSGGAPLHNSGPRATNMYFLNESTVTALAWPLTSFTLSWPSTSPGTGDLPVTRRMFKAANQTIMIAVALVVRAHVLQAVLCYRRVQYRRALQCLHEARGWVVRQFAPAARERSLRLLWADLLERHVGLRSSSTPLPSASAPLQLHDVPLFEAVMLHVMELERRACEVMISVEECKVHYSILQSCGTLPPPPLPVPHASHSTKQDDAWGEGSGLMEGPAVHAPDLRLHFRRYQESVQQLHHISHIYMQVLEWMDEEEKDGNCSEEGEQRALLEAGRRVRVKVEEGEEACRGDESPPLSSFDHTSEKTQALVLPAAMVKCVRSQISPFSLCALHHHSLPRVALPTSDEHGSPLVEASDALAFSSLSSYAVCYDQRLAAVVLGWYHCVSFLYVLSQPISSASSSTTLPSRVSGSVKREDNKDIGKRKSQSTSVLREAAFFARYAAAATAAGAAVQQVSGSGRSSASPSRDDVPTLETPVDPVQRALMHFRVCAAAFDSSPSDEGEAQHMGGAQQSSGGTVLIRQPPHEAALLLCLAEVGLADNFPFALRFCTDGNDAQTQGRREAVGGEGGGGELEAKKAAAASGTPPPVSRKRDRTTNAAAAAAALAETPSRSQPSWNWVLPGVRGVLRLYMELLMVVMQAASTMQTQNTTSNSSTPPPSPVVAGAARGSAGGNSSTTTTVTASSPPVVPAVPILQVGLQRAEQLLARLLFTLDREMLQLTGNAWGAGGFSAPTPTSFTNMQPNTSSTRQRADVNAPGGSGNCSNNHASPCRWTDRLQPSSPAQLRWLVQIKTAALLTMSRHHLTQLSLARAMFYVREMQQFSRVFHKQAKLSSLVPEMHVLLAATATYMSLRRLPHFATPRTRQRRETDRGAPATAAPSRTSRSTSFSEDDDDDELGSRDEGEVPQNDDAIFSSTTSRQSLNTDPYKDANSAVEALYALAQGWPSVEVASASSSLTTPFTRGTHSSSAATSAFAVLPHEEMTVAQDVGLPYLHILAAERAACTSLVTPPSFFLLLYLMKAWAVYQLVALGDELTWADEAPVNPTGSPVVPPPPHETSSAGTISTTGSPSSGARKTTAAATLSPLSPTCGPLPLPTASYATTTLNTTVEDQQRRVARLDSLTSTPTSTPTLRGRHATLPAEMQRIQLDAPAITSPTLSPVTPDPTDNVQPAPPLVSERTTSGGEAPAGGSDHGGEKASAEQTTPRPIPVNTTAAPAAATASSSASLKPSLPASRGGPVAQVGAVSLSVRHRAGDVLQRMVAVLRHHYEAYMAATSNSAEYMRSSSQRLPAASSVPLAAWTPQNIILFRLLRGAVLLTEDRDEPAAAREVKETTHFAKQRLGVLHPFVADGLALLTRAYVSLDVDSTSVGSNDRGGGGGGGATTLSGAAAPPAQDSATRTRRVAVQLALRCSCTALSALASTHTAAGASGAIPTGAAAESPRTSATGVNGSHHNSSGAMGMTTPQVDAIDARLREWWSRQVLEELCGNGATGRSVHAVRQLRAVFHWLPGTPDYSL